VKAALEADRALADSSITVKSVNAGVVLLSGKARTLSDAYRAVDVTAFVPGVRRVASEIESPDTLAMTNSGGAAPTTGGLREVGGARHLDHDCGEGAADRE